MALCLHCWEYNDNELGEFHSYEIQKTAWNTVIASVSRIHVSISLQDNNVSIHSTAVK